MTENKIFPVLKHEYVIATVDDVGKLTFKFANNEYLKEKKITGISHHTNSYLTTSPENKALVASAVAMTKGFLTLKTTKGVEQLNKMPLYMLTPGVNAGGTYEKAFPLKYVQIDWEQSYVTVANGTSLVANTVFMFSVFFEEDNDCSGSK